jgi:hypothetical protein
MKHRISLNVTFSSDSLFPPAAYHSHFSCPTMHAVWERGQAPTLINV